MPTLAWACIALCACSVGLLLAAEEQGPFWLKALSKTVAALAYVGLGLALGLGSGGPAGAAFLAGLLLSVVGDVCLLSKSRSWFLAGTVAFLVAHVAYSVGFLLLGLDGVAVGVAGALLALPAVLMGRAFAARAQGMVPAVWGYVAVISVMVACAIGALAAHPHPATLGLLISAVAFYLSDITVALDRFVQERWRNRAVGLPLYFGAQLGFAASAALATL